MKPQAYHIQVLNRAFQTLDALAGRPAGLGLTGPAEQLNLHKSTAHRLAMVLESARFIERDAASGKYNLGPKLSELDRAAVARLDVYEIARPHLRALAAAAGETAHLGVLREGEVISLVHCSSIGKAILAFAAPHEIDSWLHGRKFTPYTLYTIKSSRRFRQELNATRVRDYSLDNEEREEGLRCIGAPVRDSSGSAVAAISIAGASVARGDQRGPSTDGFLGDEDGRADFYGFGIS